MYSERGRYVINIYIRTDPITLPCSLARAGNKIFQHYIIRAKNVPLLYSDVSGKFLEICVCVWLQTSQSSAALLDYIFRIYDYI